MSFNLSEKILDHHITTMAVVTNKNKLIKLYRVLVHNKYREGGRKDGKKFKQTKF